MSPTGNDETSELRRQVGVLEDEIMSLRRRLQDAPRRVQEMESRLNDSQEKMSRALAQNDRLATVLEEAREQLAVLRAEVDKLTSPPNSFGTVTAVNDDGTVDLISGNRKLRVAAQPNVEVKLLQKGQEVLLNESFSIIDVRSFDPTGEVVRVREQLDDGRLVVIAHTDDERVVNLADSIQDVKIRPGDFVRVDTRADLVIERLARPEVEELVLEEIPDVTYEQVGGLTHQIEEIRDAVELPYIHRDLFQEYGLEAPKGILLYGPPGCGKTLIAKAVANSLAKAVAERTGLPNARSYFLNIKGPELLNKWVGETERQIRLIFSRAKEKSDEGVPVIVFFDEMDSLFRIRGSGISSDVESTIVPQLLSELDGVESLKNVIVIGASNREDLIDPAILRPGRLDVKIKISRPGNDAAREIFKIYLNEAVPLDADELAACDNDAQQMLSEMIESTVAAMYSDGEENRFLEVTYANGDREVLYFKDFSSGAMIENIVRRAKKDAIKRQIAGGTTGIRRTDLLAAIKQEFREHEDLPNTTNPDDWAKISGKKGERIVYVRTLIGGDTESRLIEAVTGGSTFRPMAIHKVLGTETEYGITVRGVRDFNPALASTQLVNSYPGRRVRVQWSYEEESPGRDARGFGHEGYGVSDPEGALVNAVLANGARLYVDHAHPEFSGPECYDALEGTLYDKVGEIVMRRAAEAARGMLPPGQRLAVYKNNSDGKGNSYGAHENYLLARETPFGEVIRFATTFLVSRQIFTGAGKVGSENGRPDVDFQLTQRADFFEEEVGLETTLKRPIINTRDEPHGDPSKYRRLHVIIGDANLSETQIFLKLGTMALLLAALEDGALPEPLDLSDPVSSCWQVSHDLSLGRPLMLDGSPSATALELQWRYHEWLRKYVETEYDDPVALRVIETWESVLADLEADPMLAADRLDWVAKRRLLEGFVERDGLGWDNPKLRLADIQYHDVDPARSLHRRLVEKGAMVRLFTDEEVAKAETEPPERTRAYFRGRCVSRFPNSLVAANWDSLVFDIGESHLKRIPMMEPLRGDRTRVGALLDSVDDAAALIAALGGH